MATAAPLAYVDASLHMDDVPLTAIAEAVGTPTYVYSAGYIRAQVQRLKDAFAGVDLHVHLSLIHI